MQSNQKAKLISVLVAEPEPDYFRKLQKEDPDFSLFNFEIVTDGADAQKKLKNNKEKYSAILVSPEVSKPSGLTVIKGCHMFHPGIPIFGLVSMTEQFDPEVENEKIGIAASLGRPFTCKDLLNLLGPSVSHFDSSKAMEVSSKFHDKIDEDLDVGDSSFKPIKAELFISGSKSMFDVYVKLRAGKYIKLLQAGDDFDYKRLLIYLEKGVEYFHIRKEAQESYVNYCDKLTQAITKSPKIPLDKKFGFLFNQAEITINAMSELGVNNETIAYSQKYTNNVMGLVQDLGNGDQYLGGLLKELSQFEHSASVVLISSMLAKEIGVETAKSLETLGVAAMLHDIGLFNDKDLGDYDFGGEDIGFFDEEALEEKLNSKKVFGDEKEMMEKVYSQHAKKGSKMLNKIKGMNPLAPQIVLQHHAFDEKEKKIYKGGPVHPLSEILAISDRFVKILRQHSKNGDSVDPKMLQSKVKIALSAFPRASREAFKNVFGIG